MRALDERQTEQLLEQTSSTDSVHNRIWIILQKVAGDSVVVVVRDTVRVLMEPEKKTGFWSKVNPRNW